jgi:N-acetylmuramoyl-L-alanine amidase
MRYTHQKYIIRIYVNETKIMGGKMKIYFVNLQKYNIMRYKSTAIVAFIVLVAVTFGFFARIYRDELTVETVASERLIILDAGHGGEDPGTSTADGVLEKDLNLEITLLLGQMLMDKGYTVIYTRTEDKLLYAPEENIKGIRKISDLKNRCKIAKEYPEAIFISIHMNSFGSSKYSGLQVYYSTKTKDSEHLANLIQSSVKENLQLQNNRKIKPGNKIYVLENIENIGVLIECGFLSNADEAKKLSEKEYQKILCFSIICGIIEYMNEKTQ